MSGLASIKRPVEKEMAEFEAYFSRTLRSEVPLLKIILNFSPERQADETVACFPLGTPERNDH